MKLLRNPDVRLGSWVMAALAILGCGFAWYRWGLDTAICLLLLCILFYGVFLGAAAWRYRRIRTMGEEIDRILHGGTQIFLDSCQEGELGILESEIQKMTVRLREQHQSLLEEKVHLADSLADISHQIRTPLTSINLLVQLLGEENQSPQRKTQLLRELRSLLARIDWLITVLLKMSKLDAGVVQLKQEKIPLESLLHKAAEPLLVPMELRDIAFYTESQGYFYGDMEWTCEALGNVLKNCMEHTPAGGEIRITAQENPLYTQIVVGDNGPGIAPEDLPHIFQRFYRGKNASGSGFGVGLALARTIVISQNGTIKAENNPKGGARFTIRFYKGAV